MWFKSTLTYKITMVYPAFFQFRIVSPIVRFHPNSKPGNSAGRRWGWLLGWTPRTVIRRGRRPSGQIAARRSRLRTGRRQRRHVHQSRHGRIQWVACSKSVLKYTGCPRKVKITLCRPRCYHVIIVIRVFVLVIVVGHVMHGGLRLVVVPLGAGGLWLVVGAGRGTHQVQRRRWWRLEDLENSKTYQNTF